MPSARIHKRRSIVTLWTAIYLLLVGSGILVLRQGVSITWQPYYYLDALYAFLVILVIVYRGKFILATSKKTYICIIPLVMILTWAYGIALGLIMNNNRSFVLRNNAGMLMYVLFYVMINGAVGKFDVCRLLENVSFAVVIANLIGFFVVNFLPGSFLEIYMKIPFLNCLQIGGKLGIFHPVMHYGRDIIFLCYGCAFWDVLKTGKIKSTSMLKVLLIAFLVVIGMHSGGAELALIINSFLMIVCFVKKGNSKAIGIVLCTIVVSALGILLGSGSVMQAIFSKKDVGNSVRYEQIDFFLKHINWHGWGFGADLSEIGRDYVMEISYIDLFYKIGIFCIPAFACYLLTLFYGYRYLNNGKTKYATMPICCMSFLYSALGNSVLYTNSSVVLHIIAICIIIGVIKTENENRYMVHI